MSKPKKNQSVPMDTVITWLGDNHPNIDYEVERNWIWVKTDLSPLHKKCQCEECERRKAIRQSLVNFDGQSVGFIYKNGDHVLPSGETARWAHHCDKPIRFGKGSKASGSEHSDDKPAMSNEDAELLRLLQQG